jgi:hypothetical protein
LEQKRHQKTDLHFTKRKKWRQLSLQKMQIINGSFCKKEDDLEAHPARPAKKIVPFIKRSERLDLFGQPLQGRISGNGSRALDKVGWEATGWKITFQFPIGPD